MSDDFRKEIVNMKDQMDRNILCYEKRLDDMMNDRKSMIQENDQLKDRLNGQNKKMDDYDNNVAKINNNLNHTLSEITKLEFDQKAEIERSEVKLRLLDETVNKRNEKYTTLVKEQKNLTKQIDLNDKSRSECEKRIVENGDKLKKKFDDINRNNNINYKDTIEML